MKKNRKFEEEILAENPFWVDFVLILTPVLDLDLTPRQMNELVEKIESFFDKGIAAVIGEHYPMMDESGEDSVYSYFVFRLTKDGNAAKENLKDLMRVSFDTWYYPDEDEEGFGTQNMNFMLLDFLEKTVGQKNSFALFNDTLEKYGEDAANALEDCEVHIDFPLEEDESR